MLTDTQMGFIVLCYLALVVGTAALVYMYTCCETLEAPDNNLNYNLESHSLISEELGSRAGRKTNKIEAVMKINN